MKFTCLQEHLSQKLSIVNRAVAPKSTLSILSNVRMVAENNQLKLTATNLQWGITTHVGVDIEKPGEITVPGVLLSNFVSALPQQKLVFQTTKKSLRVETSQGWANLRGVGTEDFPEVLEEGSSQGVGIDSLGLHKALAGVTFATAVDESRPILTGVLLKLSGETARFVGVDGFRLSEFTLPLTNSYPGEVEIVLPSRSLQELSRLLSGEKTVTFSVVEDRSQAVFEVGETVLSSRLMEGDFPQYQQIIPQEFNTTATLSVDEFKQAIKLSSLFAEGTSNVVRLNFSAADGKVVIAATAKEVGTNETSLTAKITGEDGAIAFNGKYLGDFLNYMETLESSEENPQVEIRIKDSVSPGYFCSHKHPEYLHIIMPVKIQD